MLVLRSVLGSDTRSPIHIILIMGTATHIRTTAIMGLPSTLDRHSIGTTVTTTTIRGGTTGITGIGIKYRA